MLRKYNNYKVVYYVYGSIVQYEKDYKKIIKRYDSIEATIARVNGIIFYTKFNNTEEYKLKEK